MTKLPQRAVISLTKSCAIMIKNDHIVEPTKITPFFPQYESKCVMRYYDHHIFILLTI